MTVALTRPEMTRDAFMAWARQQSGKYEFDGRIPLAMTRVTYAHAEICQNIYAALRARLQGGPFRVVGPDSAILTAGSSVRCPDAVVTGTRPPADSYVIPDPVIVFEVSSPSTWPTDSVIKAREYQGVPTILRYVMIETSGVGLLVLSRKQGSDAWTAEALLSADH